jgi:hypothetical protein
MKLFSPVLKLKFKIIPATDLASPHTEQGIGDTNLDTNMIGQL